MSAWRQVTTVAVLCAFVGLPVATAACDVMCAEATHTHVPSMAVHVADTMPEHHHGAAHADRELVKDGAFRLTSLAMHECGSADVALLQSEVVTQQRGDANATVLAPILSLMSAVSRSLTSASKSHDSSPPATRSAPTLLVLRV